MEQLTSGQFGPSIGGTGRSSAARSPGSPFRSRPKVGLSSARSPEPPRSGRSAAPPRPSLVGRADGQSGFREPVSPFCNQLFTEHRIAIVPGADWLMSPVNGPIGIFLFVAVGVGLNRIRGQETSDSAPQRRERLKLPPRCWRDPRGRCQRDEHSCIGRYTTTPHCRA